MKFIHKCECTYMLFLWATRNVHKNKIGDVKTNSQILVHAYLETTVNTNIPTLPEHYTRIITHTVS